MPAGPHFVTPANTLLSENIPNIWHKSSTKHKEVRPDWNDKNDNASYALNITWKVLPMAQVAIFKEIFDQVRKDLDCDCFNFWTKTSQRSQNIYLYKHGQYSRVILNDNTVLIKGLKKVVNVKFSRETRIL